jgi:hypothetical protein
MSRIFCWISAATSHPSTCFHPPQGLSPPALHRLLLLCPRIAGIVLNNCTFGEQDWLNLDGALSWPLFPTDDLPPALPRGCAPALTELVLTSAVREE